MKASESLAPPLVLSSVLAPGPLPAQQPRKAQARGVKPLTQWAGSRGQRPDQIPWLGHLPGCSSHPWECPQGSELGGSSNPDLVAQGAQG